MVYAQMNLYIVDYRYIKNYTPLDNTITVAINNEPGCLSQVGPDWSDFYINCPHNDNNKNRIVDTCSPSQKQVKKLFDKLKLEWHCNYSAKDLSALSLTSDDVKDCDNFGGVLHRRRTGKMMSGVYNSTTHSACWWGLPSPGILLYAMSQYGKRFFPQNVFFVSVASNKEVASNIKINFIEAKPNEKV